MRICASHKPLRATTLMEVVIAICVLGIMAAGIIGSHSYGFFIMQLVRENQRATQVMLEKVETIRLYSWDQVLTPGFIPAAFEDVYDPQSPTNSQGVVYNGTVTITNVPFSGTYSANMRQVIIRLNWNSKQNFKRTRSLATFVSKDGLQNYVY